MNLTPTDLIQKPLAAIQLATEQLGVDAVRTGNIPDIPALFSQGLQLAGPTSYRGSIPSLNNGLHQVLNGSLVRFRCMVQNHFDPEYYLPFFLEKDPMNGGQTTVKNARYHDSPLTNENTCMDVDHEFPPADRAVINCCAVPGETNWIKAMHETLDGQAPALPFVEVFNDSLAKRKRVEDEDASSSMHEERKSADPVGNLKHSRTEAGSTGSECKHINMVSEDVVDVYPPALSAVVKLYDNQKVPKIGQTIEVIGVQDIHHESNDEAGFFDQKQVAPGSSSLHKYRIHAIEYKVLDNFHVPVVADGDIEGALLHDTCSDDFKRKVHALTENSSLQAAREVLLRGLTSVCAGDSVAAYAVLLHLLTSCTWKPECVGKQNISLTNLARSPLQAATEIARDIVSLLQEVNAKVHHQSVTTTALTDSLFVPVKDEESAELHQGSLQATGRTSLVIDETAMQAGQIDGKGIENLRGLAYLCEQNKLQYHFPYMPAVEFQVDTPVLVLSAENALCPSDLKISLQPASTLPETPFSLNPPQHAEPGNSPSPAANRIPSWAQQADQTYTAWNLNSIPTDQLALVQMYVYMAKLHTIMHEPQESSVQAIHQAILLRLQTCRERASVEILHILMTVAKLVAASYFKTDIDQQCWDEACTFVDLVLDRSK